jgi:hypothetical protein
MTAYNFPNSPSDGDTVTSNGITYTYSSSKTRWDAAAASGSSTTVYATIDLLPLSGASTGDQAYVSGNNRLYIWNGSGWYNIALINTTPSISGVSSSYGLAVDGTATTVTITATDPEGIPITYSIASDTSGNVATVSQGTGSNTNVFTITPSTNTANGGTFSLTFRASDGVNIATAVSEFTLIFGIPNSQFTTALVTSVGANNAANNSFDDASTNNHTITANGNVTQNTFSPYRHGGYSTYFDGSGDQIDTPTDASLTVGTGQFTIECWFQVHQDTQQTIFSLLNGTSNVVNVFYWPTDNNIGVVAPSISTYGSSNSNTVDLHKWHHLSLVRNATTMFLYVDGSLMWSTSHTDNINSNRVRIAANQYGNYLLGYVSDLRFVIGTAITPASGGPDDRLTAVTNTELLTCHLPYIADGSTNNHSLTAYGSTKTEPLSPYDHSGYTSGSNGGSMYFDGSGDWLSVSDGSWITLGSSDFTIECWAYNSVTSGSRQDLFGQGNSSGQASSISTELYINSNRTVGGGVYIGAQGYLTSTATIPVNTWTHIALARDGTTLRLYINGVQSATAYVGTATVTNQSTDFSIGRVGEYNGLYFNGNISDFRFVKGTCEYPSGTTFPPPTAPLTAITNTSLLLNGTDAGIIDKSQSVKTITLNGDTKSSTTQTKYLTTSMYFDGTGDYLQMDDQNVGNFGTLDFTAEGWIYLLDNSALYTVVDGRPSALTSASGWSVAVSTSGQLYIYSGGFLITGASSAVTANNWHHWAYTRENGTHKLFLNGTQTGSSSTSSRDFTAQLFRIGASGTGGEVFKGYQSDVRITKGLARYTSNFTVPSAALEG